MLVLEGIRAETQPAPLRFAFRQSPFAIGLEALKRRVGGELTERVPGLRPVGSVLLGNAYGRFDWTAPSRG